jgi:hypothetical protein
MSYILLTKIRYPTRVQLGLGGYGTFTIGERGLPRADRRAACIGAVIGKESLVKSLGTGNRSLASRLAHPYIGEFKSRIAEAATASNYRLKAWGSADSGEQYQLPQ